MSWVRRNWKWLIHLAGSLAVLAVPLVSNDQAWHDRHQWINAGILAAGTILVAVNANLEAGVARYAKGIIAGVTAGLVALNTLTLWPPDRAAVIQVIVAGVMAVSVALKGQDAPLAVQASGPGRMGDQWPDPATVARHQGQDDGDIMLVTCLAACLSAVILLGALFGVVHFR